MESLCLVPVRFIHIEAPPDLDHDRPYPWLFTEKPPGYQRPGVWKVHRMRYPSDEENDLSDLTWALGRNCEEFLKSLVFFFCFNLNPDLPTEIVREDSLGEGCRSDISIENGDTVFVIENKIYGRNYHIEQYGRLRFLREKEIGKLGLITNYRIDDITRAKARGYNFTTPGTWEQFSRYLDSKMQEKSFSADWEDVIKGYIEYVKEVCSIMEIKEIRFGSLSSLAYFNRLVKKVVEQFQSETLDCQLYKIGSAFGENWSGQYFSFKKKGGKSAVYPFFGIYYNEEPPTIVFSFENDWCEEIYSKFKGKHKEGSFFDIWSDENEVTFELNEKKYGEFVTSSGDRQEAILQEFVQGMTVRISSYL